jgi:hypothetical protein
MISRILATMFCVLHFCSFSQKSESKLLKYYYADWGCPSCNEQHPENVYGFTIECIGCIITDSIRIHNEQVVRKLDGKYGSGWTSNYLSAYCENILPPQIVTDISDTSHVGMYTSTNDPDIGTLVYVFAEDRCTIPWKVYYNKKKTKLAYEGIIAGDTCIESNYWQSNGKLKRRVKHYKVPYEDYYNWIHEEIYCENGQLLRKCNPNNPGTETIINYYCNGQKKNEFTFTGMSLEGKYTAWLENGQKEFEGMYLSNNKDGEWKYWNEKGELLRTETYKSGKLVESKK